MITLYYCDYKKRKKCRNSPFCIANGGPCKTTSKEKWAMRDINGEPLENKEDDFNEKLRSNQNGSFVFTE